MKKGKFLFRPAMFLVVAVILLATSCQNDEGEVQIIQNEALVGFESQPIQGQFIVTLNGESEARKSNLAYKEVKKEYLRSLIFLNHCGLIKFFFLQPLLPVQTKLGNFKLNL